jgi:hypothetical protein
LKNRTRVILYAFTLSIFSDLAYADSNGIWQLGVGAENYTWKESPQGSATNPKESGNRLVLNIGWKPANTSSDPYLTYAGKIYGGTVNYDTSTIATNTPVQTSTDYFGMRNEAIGVVPAKIIDLVAGLGYDYWSRSIADGSFVSGNTLYSVQGYTETYSILFLRLGVSMKLFDSVELSGGIKHTLQNTESSGLAGGDLHPGSSTSPYLEANYKITQSLSVSGYYDSWRFGQSAANSSGYYQPKSSMAAIGILAIWSF